MTRHPNPPHRKLHRTGLSVILLIFLCTGLPSRTLAFPGVGNQWSSILVDLPSSSPAICVDPFPNDLNKYNAIFLGTIVETNEEELKDSKVPSTITKRLRGNISVDKMWKGTPVKMVSFVSKPIFASLLIRREQFLFYTSLLKGDIMKISMCSPIRRAKDHEVEMMFLDWKFSKLSQKKIVDRLTKILLEHEDKRFRLQAIPLLVASGRMYLGKVKRALWKALKDPSEEVRIWVVGSIYEVVSLDDEKRAIFLQCVRDSSLKVRLASLELMNHLRPGDLGEKRGEVVRILKSDLKEEEQKLAGGDSIENLEHHRIVQELIEMLIELQGEADNEQFMPLIVEGLGHENIVVRSYASSNLNVLKGRGRKNLRDLKALLKENLNDEAKEEVLRIIRRNENSQRQ
jgi:hypothetical protein